MNNIERKELFVFDKIILLAVKSSNVSNMLENAITLKSRQPGRSRIKEKELVIHADAPFNLTFDNINSIGLTLL